MSHLNVLGVMAIFGSNYSSKLREKRETHDTNEREIDFVGIWCVCVWLRRRRGEKKIILFGEVSERRVSISSKFDTEHNATLELESPPAFPPNHPLYVSPLLFSGEEGARLAVGTLTTLGVVPNKSTRQNVSAFDGIYTVILLYVALYHVIQTLEKYSTEIRWKCPSWWLYIYFKKESSMTILRINRRETDLTTFHLKTQRKAKRKKKRRDV